MSTALSRRSLRATLTTAAAAIAVAGATLVVVPAPAQAATAGVAGAGSLEWGLSTYLNSANQGRPNPLASAYAAPAAFDATSRISSWSQGSGTVASDGSARVTFAGTSVNFAPTGGGWLRLSSPAVSVDASGNGSLTALVSYGLAPGTYPDITYDAAQAPQRGPSRVEVMELAGNVAADSATAARTVTWTGLDGTWSPDLTAFLAGDSSASPSIPAWAYAPTVSEATGRTALPLTFSATVVPSAVVTTTSASHTGGLALAVAGTGFTGVTNPGDNGVYVGLAPSGGMPDVSSMGGQSGFAAASWVPAAAITGGAFNASLTAPTAALDPARSYSLYTWQAHSHSTTTQDTETPVAIDWAALAAPVAPTPATPSPVSAGLKAKLLKKPTTTSAGRLRVTSTRGATGTVRVKLTRAGAKVRTSVRTMRSGPLVVALPRLTRGVWKATVVYAGSARHLRETTSLRFTVKAPRRG